MARTLAMVGVDSGRLRGRFNLIHGSDCLCLRLSSRTAEPAVFVVC